MRAIDVHAHVIVPELLRGTGAGASESWRPAVRRRDGRHVIEHEGRTITSAVDEFVELDAILAAQERRGIDGVLLCPWVALLFAEAPAAQALERCRLQNDALAALRSRSPERVSVLGAVPLQDPELGASELERLMARGEFCGVEVPASLGGRYLGDRTFEPFWAAAQATRALVFVHPTTRGFRAPVFEEHYLWNLVGNPFETTIAAAQLVLSGTLERHPQARILLAHAGGAIGTLRGRLAHGHRAVAAAGDQAAESPRAAIGRFLFDTVTHDAELLRALIELVGADRVLLGSDYPFDMADPDPVGTVRAAGLSARAERAVLYGNAARELRAAAGVAG
ncbi:MAG TPA: amidohydrolase family protein [Solirubrobacteraceae bacterium]|nr:amidohydrolase family protein [Solirubrobacteraceae bacterium]